MNIEDFTFFTFAQEVVKPLFYVASLLGMHPRASWLRGETRASSWYTSPRGTEGSVEI